MRSASPCVAEANGGRDRGLAIDGRSDPTDVNAAIACADSITLDTYSHAIPAL